MKPQKRQAPIWSAQKAEPNAAPAHTHKPKPWDLKCAANIAPVEMQWLWYPYIPAARLTSIEGDPGVGKSWLTVALASAFSTGTPLPGQETAVPPGRILMLSVEDGLADTVVPRLVANGADLDRVFFPQVLITLDSSGIRGLKDTIHSMGASIVFVDPVQAFMGGKRDINKANEVRDFMGPLALAAEEENCAIIVVRHFRKDGGGPALTRGLGSQDFAAAVRSMLQVTMGTENIRIVRQEKNNNAPKGKPLTYSIEEGKFVWKGTITEAAAAALSTSPKAHSLARAKVFLQTILKDGPMPALEVHRRAEDEGISGTTLKRAKQGMVASEKPAGSEWIWSLSITTEDIGDGK